MNLQNVVLKVGIVLGAVGGVAGYLADAGVLQLLPAKHAATIGIVCSAASTIAAWLHPAPMQPAPEVVKPADVL